MKKKGESKRSGQQILERETDSLEICYCYYLVPIGTCSTCAALKLPRKLSRKGSIPLSSGLSVIEILSLGGFFTEHFDIHYTAV